MNNIIHRMRIPYFDIQEDFVLDAIRNGYLSTGPHLEQLKTELCMLFQKRYAVLLLNAFSAMFITLKEMANPASRILTAPISTCFSVINAIKAAGHLPVYADIDIKSASIVESQKYGKYTGAIVPDHFGIIAPACKTWRRKEGFLIEDAAQAFISRAAIRTKADVVILSFYPTKIANGIDGGALLTDDEELFEKITMSTSYTEQRKSEKIPRYNLQLSNLHAAFVLATLKKLEEIKNKLKEIYSTFGKILDNKNILYLKPKKGEVLWKLLIIASDNQTKSEWTKHFKVSGIETSNELINISEEKNMKSFPNAKELVEKSFSVPFHAGLNDKEVEEICQALTKL